VKVYTGDAIRNVAVVGHGASGKTSLVDALAFVAGSSTRHGSVQQGTALTDYTPDEIERQYSISLALAHAEWKGTKVNLIDTPGYLDFIGDALAGMSAADAALVVVSATAGVEGGTEKTWEFATVGEGPDFHGIINLFSKKCHEYKKGTKTGEYDEVDIPAELQDRFEKYSQELIETIATTNDELLERYLGGDEISRDEAIAAMKTGMAAGELFPLLCGSAERTYGMQALLSKLAELVPPPTERAPTIAEMWGTADPVELEPSDTAPWRSSTISRPLRGKTGQKSRYSMSVTSERSQSSKTLTPTIRCRRRASRSFFRESRFRSRSLCSRSRSSSAARRTSCRWVSETA
jgi:elongation factor G